VRAGTNRSKWAVALYVVAAITVLIGIERVFESIARTENFTASDLGFIAEIMSGPVILAAILCALGAALQYLFDIRAVVLSNAEVMCRMNEEDAE